MTCANLLAEFVDVTKPCLNVSLTVKKTDYSHGIITHGHAVSARPRKLTDIKAKLPEEKFNIVSTKGSFDHQAVLGQVPYSLYLERTSIGDYDSMLHNNSIFSHTR